MRSLTVKDLLLVTGLSLFLGFVVLMAVGQLLASIMFTLLVFALSCVVLVAKKYTNQDQKTYNLLEGLFNFTLDGMFLIDVNSHKILDCNQSAMAMLEVNEKDELKHADILQFLSKDEQWFEQLKQKVSEYEKSSELVDCTTSWGNTFKGNIAMMQLEIKNSSLFLLRISSDVSPDLSIREYCQQHYEMLVDKTDRNLVDGALYAELQRLGFKDKRK